MTSSITLTGTPEQLREVLSFWATLPSQPQHAAAPPDVAGPALRSEVVESFVRGLTIDGRRLVGLIAIASAAERDLPEPELWRALDADEPTVNGYKGGVGIHWAKYFNEPNPFARKGHYPGPYFYRVERELADLVCAIL